MRQDLTYLAGDGFLLTAGTVTVGLALLFGSEALFTDGGVAFEFGSSLVLFLSGLAGVVVAWLSHGRRINVAAVVGGLAGWAVGGLVIPLVAGVSFLLGLPLKLVTDNEYAGPLAMLVLISIGTAALIVWLLVDAIRDMAPANRMHFRLDVARIGAAVAFIVLVGVSVYLVFAQPGPEQGEAPIWAIAAGVLGAVMMVGAELGNVLWSRRSRPGSAVAAG